jgi:hypothetical protein
VHQARSIDSTRTTEDIAVLGRHATSGRESPICVRRGHIGASGDAKASILVDRENSHRDVDDTTPAPAVPAEFARALAAFAVHDAAVQRHVQILARLRALQREAAELKASMERLHQHNLSAAAEMRVLREAVERYTRSLREGGLPPERALVTIRTSVSVTVAALPPFERPADVSNLAADLVQCAIKAYYAA